MLLWIKFLLGIVFFFLTLFFGFLPIQKRQNSNFFDLANYFACGVFISTAIFHLLVDAAGHFHSITGHGYFYGILIALVFLLFMFFLEYSINKVTSKGGNFGVYLLSFLLIIHAFFEGLALGINKEFLEVFIIFAAIIIHKGSESFSYTVALQHYNFSLNALKKWVVLFSAMTPLGILVASVLTTVKFGEKGNLICAIFDSVAAGTFFYICFEQLNDSFRKLFHKEELCCFGGGFFLMWLLSFWT